MSKRIVGIILAVIAITAIAAVVIANKPADKPFISSQPAAKTESQNRILTKDEIAKHSSKQDCWTIISGKVYDVTSYVSRHPGGNEILRACGTDGSTLFASRETESGEEVGSGTPHSSSAHDILESFLLGDLQQ